jgi:hypothetical protein
MAAAAAPTAARLTELKLETNEFLPLLGKFVSLAKHLQNNAPDLVPKEDLVADEVISYLKPYSAPHGPLEVRATKSASPPPPPSRSAAFPLTILLASHRCARPPTTRAAPTSSSPTRAQRMAWCVGRSAAIREALTAWTLRSVFADFVRGLAHGRGASQPGRVVPRPFQA